MPFERRIFSISWNKLKSVFSSSARRDVTMWRLYTIQNRQRKPFLPFEISRRLYEPSMNADGARSRLLTARRYCFDRWISTNCLEKFRVGWMQENRGASDGVTADFCRVIVVIKNGNEFFLTSCSLLSYSFSLYFMPNIAYANFMSQSYNYSAKTSEISLKNINIQF